MARSGLPKKYAKFGFKKGWALFKKAKRKTKKSIKKVIRKVAKKTVTTYKRKKPMARKSKKSVTKRRRKVTILNDATMKIFIDSAIIGGTALASTAGINSIPYFNSWKPWQKALAQSGVGLGMLFFTKNKMVKKLSGGVMVGSAITLLKPYIPETFGDKIAATTAISGGSRKLSDAELISLQTMGKPVASMGRPLSKLGRAVKNPSSFRRMGKPISNLGCSWEHSD